MSTANIQKMTTLEQLVAIEQLWGALCKTGSGPNSPAWHEAILTKRKEKMNSADARFFTFDQIREQFQTQQSAENRTSTAVQPTLRSLL